MSNHHSKTTRDLDPEEATATLNHTGLALFYFGTDGHFEGQILRLRDHRFSFSVREIGPQGARDIDTSGKLDTESNIDITVVHPVKRGSYRYQRGRFNPKKEDNDERDFRWLVDMEGPKLHNRHLHKKPQGTPGQPAPSDVRLQRLRISDATFYTSEQSVEPYARERRNHPNEPDIFIGRVAHVFSADLTCRDESGSGIRLTNPDLGGEGLWLPEMEGFRYEINVNNICADEDVPDDSPSDFIRYYNVLQDPDNIEYDLKRAFPRGEQRSRSIEIIDFPEMKRDSHLLMCDSVNLSQTSAL